MTTHIITIEEPAEITTFSFDSAGEMVSITEETVVETFVVEYTDGDQGPPGIQGPPGPGFNKTFDELRGENDNVTGPIDFGGDQTIINLRDAVDSKEPVTLGQMAVESGNTLQAANEYTDERLDGETLAVVMARGNGTGGANIDMENGGIINMRPGLTPTEAVRLDQAQDMVAAVTLEQTRIVDNKILGDIDADGANTITNIRNAAAPQEPITQNQGDAILQAAKDYADTVSAITVRSAGFWDPTGGIYPNGTIGGVKFGYEYEASNTVTVIMPDGKEVEKGDLFRARITNPGQNPLNWYIGQGNTQQATEVVQGTLKVTPTVEIQNENTTDDKNAVTTVKFWLGWARIRSIVQTIGAVWTFDAGIRLTNLSANQYVRTNGTNNLVSLAEIPQTDVTGLTAALTARELTANKDASGGYVGLTLFKINFKNVANTFTSFLTNANTAARTYTFKDRSSTIADDIDLALKSDLAIAGTGTVVAFAAPIVYNSPGSPGTGNVTDNLTGAKIGVIQKIYHNSGTAPTFPAGWVILGTGTYTISTLNVIYAEWVSGTRVEYWITK